MSNYPAAAMGLPEYDAIRRRLKEGITQRRQETQDAISRRFAAQGMTASGAYGKAQEEADRNLGREEQDALAQIGFAESSEAQRRKELEEQRKFTTSERLGAQSFARSERQEGQRFTSSEREASQLFNRELFDRDMAFKVKRAT